MMRFDDLIFKPNYLSGGVFTQVFFSNGFGASVIRSPLSYGGDAGLYELAVLKCSGDSWGVCYETPITDEVLGYLSETEVSNLLIQIEELNDD